MALRYPALSFFGKAVSDCAVAETGRKVFVVEHPYVKTEFFRLGEYKPHIVEPRLLRKALVRARLDTQRTDARPVYAVKLLEYRFVVLAVLPEKWE